MEGDGFVRSAHKLVFDAEMKPRPMFIGAVVACFVIYALLIYLASWADGTLILPGTGRGLLVHYGFQATYLTSAFVLINLVYVISLFIRLLKGIEQFVEPGCRPSLVAGIVSPHLDSIGLNSKWRRVLWLFAIIGLMGSIAIFRELDDPVKFWGNDVFNAKKYVFGYILANLALAFSWTVIYPAAIFFAIHITISSELIIRRMSEKNILNFDFLHDDNCCGLSRFGTLNFSIMLMYLWPLSAMLALHFTHSKNYMSLVVGAAIAFFIFIIQSFYGIYTITKSIGSAKKRALARINTTIYAGMENGDGGAVNALAALAFREKILSTHSYPYTSNILVSINVLRYAPAAVALAKYVRDVM